MSEDGGLFAPVHAGERDRGAPACRAMASTTRPTIACGAISVRRRRPLRIRRFPCHRVGITLDSPFETVLAAARTGAEWAWETIYRELSPPVLGYLRGRGALEPEDLVGEVFLQVVRDLERFDGAEAEFRAWVFTIAHHRLLDDRRGRGRRPVEPLPTDALPEKATTDSEDEVLARLGDEEVRRLLSSLSDDQQSVLLLRVLGDLTVEEVARAVGKRPGTVKALQRRGLAAIKRELTRQGVPL